MLGSVVSVTWKYGLQNMDDDDVQQLVDEAVTQVGGVRGKEPEMTAEQVTRALQHINFKTGRKAIVKMVKVE